MHVAYNAIVFNRKIAPRLGTAVGPRVRCHCVGQREVSSMSQKIIYPGHGWYQVCSMLMRAPFVWREALGVRGMFVRKRRSPYVIIVVAL